MVEAPPIEVATGKTPEKIIITCLSSKEVPQHTAVQMGSPIIALERYSEYHHLKRITAWIIRFIRRCQKRSNNIDHLSATELNHAENYWIRYSQESCFGTELKMIKDEKLVSAKSQLKSLNPFIDTTGLLRMNELQTKCESLYSYKYPLILHGRHKIVRLIIRHEHIRLLHAGTTLMMLH
jgi:hypothetical protein